MTSTEVPILARSPRTGAATELPLNRSTEARSAAGRGSTGHVWHSSPQRRRASARVRGCHETRGTEPLKLQLGLFAALLVCLLLRAEELVADVLDAQPQTAVTVNWHVLLHPPR
jgi:hypothetical protein